jgi:3-hydroxybutyrate dehydrogenase
MTERTGSGLSGQVAVVTGAASGIGRGIALALAQAGAALAILDQNGEGAREVAQRLDDQGMPAMAITVDVTEESQVDAAMDAVLGRFGRIDILVSNAGIQIVSPLEDLCFADWKRLLAIHLDGAFLTTRAVLRPMYRQSRGSIIYMGSVHSKLASPLKAPYITAKHGLIGLAKAVAREGGKHGVKANVVCPGFVRTPLVERQIPEQARALGVSEAAIVSDVMLRDTVDGEFTTVEEVAAAVLFLASFDTNALTGQSLMVSHGWFMQ